MSDPNLPFQPFAKTNGWVVPSAKVEQACWGAIGDLEDVEVQVAHGESCTFMVIRMGSGVKYFRFSPECTAVLGHALLTAVGK